MATINALMCFIYSCRFDGPLLHDAAWFILLLVSSQPLIIDAGNHERILQNY